MRRRRAREGPEDSVLLRAVILAAVMIAAVAVVAQHAVDGGTAAGTLILLPVGFAFSYLRRTRRNTLLKVCLAGAMFFALGSFIQAVRVAPSVDDARVSLASLFLWTQVLHSFDLPRRRDLAFSMVSSLILMAEAGSLSLGSGFALLLLPYGGSAGTWLYLSHRSEEERRADPAAILRDPRRRGTSAVARARGQARGLAAAGAAVLLASSAVFLAVPRAQGVRIIAPPFSLSRKVAVPGFSGAVVAPDLPSQQGTRSGPLGGGYPGFGDSVDLGVRWRLSDRVVMKVRAAQPAFWRAEAFDTFDGARWTVSHSATRFVASVFGPPITLPLPGGAVESSLSARTRSHELIQTFYVIAPQPNVVFAAFEPRDLYFPVDRVAVDDYASVRSPLFLEAGTIYSVVSHVPAASPAELRAAAPVLPPFAREFARQYTQLPLDLSPRVRELAHRITDPAPTAYDKVMAVQAWLAANLRYNLDIPADPPGSDPLEEFLFHRRQGYCEHFSTAMVVLLRAVGIPARFAVGFGTGERNPFTGYFEVRESDAHSWVEVFYPGVGWMEYDPTHDVPQADSGLAGRFIAPEVFRAVGRFLARIVPGPVRSAGRAVGSAMTRAWRALPGGPVGAPVGGAMVAAGAVLILRRRRRRRQRPPPDSLPIEAFRSMVRTFERRGRPRPEHRTPHEHLLALLVEDRLALEARPDLELIVRAFERESFSGVRAGPDEGRLAGEAAGRVRTLARARPRPR